MEEVTAKILCNYLIFWKLKQTIYHKQVNLSASLNRKHPGVVFCCVAGRRKDPNDGRLNSKCSFIHWKHSPYEINSTKNPSYMN